MKKIIIYSLILLTISGILFGIFAYWYERQCCFPQGSEQIKGNINIRTGVWDGSKSSLNSWLADNRYIIWPKTNTPEDIENDKLGTINGYKIIRIYRAKLIVSISIMDLDNLRSKNLTKEISVKYNIELHDLDDVKYKWRLCIMTDREYY